MNTPKTTVTIHNDLDGTRRTLVLPTTVDEAHENCLEVVRAVNYANLLELAAELPVESPDSDSDAHLAVTIRKTADTIRIQWWPSGDVEEARAKLAEIQQGRAFA